MLSLQVSASQLVLCLASQVCIQLHPLAVNMAMPALYQSCPPLLLQQYRWTDAQQLHRPCSAYCVGSAKNVCTQAWLLTA